MRQPPIYCWLDLEMTGLDPHRCAIVQLAMIVTDAQLRELAPPLELTIWQPPHVLAAMNPFVRHMHTKSGLLGKIERSEIDTSDAQQEAMRLLTAHAPYRVARLCGNSITQDRLFLLAHMPHLEHYLHYRQVDVSSIKELAAVWNRMKFKKPDDGQHTALFDVRQSLAELQYYRKNLFVQPTQ